jgi:ABC-type dipeptide/oligopeptide/nickel transport system permease subunit
VSEAVDIHGLSATSAPRRRAWRWWVSVPAVSAYVLGVFIVVAVIGPWIEPHDPNVLGVATPLAHPSASAWFGADELGRDLLSRELAAVRVAMLVAVASVGLAMIVGTVLGVLAGYFRRGLDLLTMRTMDVIFAFPELILAIIVIAALGPSLATAIVSIAIVYVPRFARVARAATLTVAGTSYVEAARLSSLSAPRIVLRHVLPNIRTPLIVMAALSMSTAQLAYAALSFLGFGARAPQADFGSMLAEGKNFMTFDIWMVLFPGLGLVLLIVAFNLCGDAIRDALDPQSGRSRVEH